MLFTAESVTGFLLKCLWVACGFAGGYFLTLIAGIGYDKLVAKKPSPPFLHTWARRIGGVIVAIIVAFFVFPGGTGNGLGGGPDPGQQGGGQTPVPTSQATTPAKPPATEPKREQFTAGVVSVTIFDGLAAEESNTPGEPLKRFEVVGETGKKNMREVSKIVSDRRTGVPGVMIVYTLDANTTPKSGGVKQLQEVADDLGVTLMPIDEYKKLPKQK